MWKILGWTVLLGLLYSIHGDVARIVTNVARLERKLDAKLDAIP